MESGCLTAGTPWARELQVAAKAQQPTKAAARTPGQRRGGLAGAQCLPASILLGPAQHAISFQFPTLLIVFQDKERWKVEDKEKESKEPNWEKKKTVKKWGVMIKAGERDEKWKHGIFILLPPPRSKGVQTEERWWRDESRPVRTCTPVHVHVRTGPAGRRHMAEKVIPQSEMATKAPAQWYPFVKAVAIKGP